MLTARGMHVLTAEDGLTALEQIDRHQPDVALIDLRMPGMDGFEVLAAMRERTMNCEAIMMTAYADVDVAGAGAGCARTALTISPIPSARPRFCRANGTAA